MTVNMIVKLVFLIAACCGIAVVLSMIPFRRKKIIREAGEVIYAMNHKNLSRLILVNVIAVFLSVIVFKMNYNYLVSGALSACAVAASFIVTKDAGISDLDGVYENAILCNGNFIKYSDIKEFPVFKLPKKDQELYAKNALVIVTNKNIKTELVFASDEECQRVIAQLVQMKVIKK